MKVTFIVGNGLDLSQGLNTRYTDFYEYIQAKQPKPVNQIYQAITDDPETWSDFEWALGEHTQIVEEFGEADRPKALEKLYAAFDEVLEDLGDYLHEQDEKARASVSTYIMGYSDFYSGLLGESARRIGNLLKSVAYDANFITLNYTSTLERMLYPLRNSTKRNGVNLGRIHHAHGELSEYITMGVSNESQVSPALDGEGRDNLVKPRLLQSMNDDRIITTTNIINSSDIIVIYGTSYGSTDEYLWRQVAEWLRFSNKRIVILHDRNTDQLKKPTRNPTRIKLLDNEAKNRLLEHAGELSEDEKLELRSQILVVRNTQKLFKA